MDVKNIYCVGRNYREHAKELGNKVGTEPMLFSKPTHAFVYGETAVLELPEDELIHYEAELVVTVKKEWEPGIPLGELLENVAVGIDFTLRDKQEALKEKRHPWLLAKGFPNSAAVGPFIPFQEDAWEDITFSLQQNGVEKQAGSPKEMIFSLRELVDFTGKHIGLGAGDLLFTGTPAGVGPAADGDELKLTMNQQHAGTFHLQIRNEK